MLNLCYHMTVSGEQTGLLLHRHALKPILLALFSGFLREIQKNPEGSTLPPMTFTGTAACGEHVLLACVIQADHSIV